MVNDPPPLFYTRAELATLPEPTWLIDKVLPDSGLGVIYGEPGCGKTFVALSIAAAVATGSEWFETKTLCGPVLYIVGEGLSGFKDRVDAWEQASDQTVRDIYFSSREADFFTDDKSVAACEDFCKQQGIKPKLIVVDTLARCFGTGDENKTPDMNKFVANLRRLERQLGCAVLVVHHTGKNGSAERGNTALRGAADTMIFAKANKHGLQLICTKQKEEEEFPTMHFHLKKVNVAPGRTSCVIESDGLKPQGDQNLSDNAKAVLKVLADSSIAVQRKDIIQASKVPEGSIDGVLKQLQDQGLVGSSVRGKYEITEEGKTMMMESNGMTMETKSSHPYHPPPKGGMENGNGEMDIRSWFGPDDGGPGAGD